MLLRVCIDNIHTTSYWGIAAVVQIPKCLLHELCKNLILL